MAQEETQENGAPAVVSRREFVKQAGAGVVALASISIGGVNLFSKSPPVPLDMSTGVIMPDPTLCIGCLTCEVICSKVHRDEGLSDIPRIRIYNDEATVVDQEIVDNYGDRGQYHQSPCLMCPDAPCHYVCPADALVIDVEFGSGVRYIDQNKCIACGRCAEACPFPAFSESEATGREVLGQMTRIIYDPVMDVYTKCDLCYWRPEGPACVEACPVNVRINQGILESDRLCLDKPAATPEHWAKQSEQDWAWHNL